jgi:hypothetical protein
MLGSRRVGRGFLGVTAACALVASVVVAVPARAASAGSGDAGVGTKAALQNPDCDPATGRIRFPTLSAPPCVKPWKDGANNGGATAQGVTKDTIKVVVLYVDVKQDDRSPASTYKNQATGGFSNQRDPIIDADAVYAHSFETWGRKVEYVFVKGTGPDETAQRADATTVAAMKPFAVFDAAIQGGNQSNGGLVFETTLQQRGVPVVLGAAGAPPRSPKEASQQIAANAAEFAGKSLVGKKAQYGGSDVSGEQRSFGILYQGGENGFDIEYFKKQFAKYGGKLAADGEAAFAYDPGISQADATAQAQEQMPTLMTRLKNAGVTTIIDVLDARYGLRPAMQAATAAEFFPEWVIASGGPVGGGAFPADLPILVRSADAQQMAHAFGLIWFWPYVENQSTLMPFTWFWGTDKGSVWTGAQAMVGALYGRIHLAGPALTGAKMKPGALPSKPAGGQFSKSVLTPAGGADKNGNPIIDAALAWWSGTTNGFDPITRAKGDGMFLYLDGGRRYNPGSFPKNKTGFFDESLTTTVYQFTDPPPTEPMPTNYPCEGCPSTGSATPAPSAL